MAWTDWFDMIWYDLRWKYMQCYETVWYSIAWYDTMNKHDINVPLVTYPTIILSKGLVFLVVFEMFCVWLVHLKSPWIEMSLCRMLSWRKLILDFVKVQSTNWNVQANELIDYESSRLELGIFFVTCYLNNHDGLWGEQAQSLNLLFRRWWQKERSSKAWTREQSWR